MRSTIIAAGLLLASGLAIAQQNVPTPIGAANTNRAAQNGEPAAPTPSPAVPSPAVPSPAVPAPAIPTPDPESETALSRRIREIAQRQQEAADSAPAATSTYTPTQLIAYNEWVLSYTRGAYAWHHTSTVIIFFVVISVVLSGVVLAAWQLRSWLGRVVAYDKVFLSRLEQGHEVDAALIAETGKAGSHELNLQSKAVALTTPYVGVVILGLSMGFFLAYLLLVYPILQGP